MFRNYQAYVLKSSKQFVLKLKLFTNLRANERLCWVKHQTTSKVYWLSHSLSFDASNFAHKKILEAHYMDNLLSDLKCQSGSEAK